MRTWQRWKVIPAQNAHFSLPAVMEPKAIAAKEEKLLNVATRVRLALIIVECRLEIYTLPQNCWIHVLPATLLQPSLINSLRLGVWIAQPNTQSEWREISPWWWRATLPIPYFTIGSAILAYDTSWAFKFWTVQTSLSRKFRNCARLLQQVKV